MDPQSIGQYRRLKTRPKTLFPYFISFLVRTYRECKPCFRWLDIITLSLVLSLGIEFATLAILNLLILF